ncbi:MAG: hypothetical protein QOF49_1600 [Chloroflexota bacterium]|jgi:hypothetical protein|nr:hypothetical protein [Chloroflexota bacterium]
MPTFHSRVRRIATTACCAALVVGAIGPGTAVAADRSGFITSAAPMISALVDGVDIKPLLTVGETIGAYRFESLPDGIAIRPAGKDTLDVYVNHETSAVPFPYNAGTGVGLADFDDAQLSHLVLKRGAGKVLAGSYTIPSSANYQRFCSNFLAGPRQGWSRELLFTNEEATDVVNRTGTAWPATPANGSNPEQAGVVVAVDVASGGYRTIRGLGRMNHENSVAVPGYDQAVLVTGDDTFSAPASQLYMYAAPNADAVWNDEGHLWAFVSNDATINDYGDLTASNSVSGHFSQVPDAIADGDQTGLENWSKANNVFQFIRIEDLATDRNDPHIVYFADTGEPRAVRNATTGLLDRGPSSAHGPFPNGRIFKMVLDPSDPTTVERLSVLIDGDAAGYDNVGALHQPDNIETTANSMLITEDPGGHNRFAGATNARLWKYDFSTGTLAPVAVAADPTADWETTGVVDASEYFGAGAFLINVQAHNVLVETDPSPISTTGITKKREGGQLLLIRIDGA